LTFNLGSIKSDNFIAREMKQEKKRKLLLPEKKRNSGVADERLSTSVV
jgi:hypothetical protein